MRRYARLLFAAMLVLPTVAFASSSGAAVAETGTDCAHTSGSAKFSPGLWKLKPAAQADQHEAAQTITAGGGVTGCSGGGVVNGILQGTINIKDPANCNSLASDSDTAVPATTGVIKISWGGGKVSTAAVSFKQVAGKPTQADIAGKVTTTSSSNTFKGLPVNVRIAFTPETGGCTAKNLQKVTFKEVTPLEIG
ncbi:MAG: hypothetical protein JWN46_1100 [Acidimicrobiales bacterium]|nr:hypothetical protein [Acidimicrobiales bacterium]